mmetsp:Transcript_55333/g.115744  ORF Transcript_55333/g.115744 Transcript_55333/m.115744 type:complete len:86 (+) Transcript_55333:250-507(+)
METLPSKCAFDRWYEALSKEHIWHQWMLHGLVKSMDIPTRNTLAHLYVNAKSPQTEKRVGSAKRAARSEADESTSTRTSSARAVS